MHKDLQTDGARRETKYEYKTYSTSSSRSSASTIGRGCTGTVRDWLQGGRPPAARPAHMRCTGPRPSSARSGSASRSRSLRLRAENANPLVGLDSVCRNPPSWCGARCRAGLRRTGRRKGQAVDRRRLVMMSWLGVRRRLAREWTRRRVDREPCRLQAGKDGHSERAAMVAACRTGPAACAAKARRCRRFGLGPDILPTIPWPRPWKTPQGGGAFSPERKKRGPFFQKNPKALFPFWRGKDSSLSTAASPPDTIGRLVDGPRWRSRQRAHDAHHCGIPWRSR